MVTYWLCIWCDRGVNLSKGYVVWEFNEVPCVTIFVSGLLQFHALAVDRLFVVLWLETLNPPRKTYDTGSHRRKPRIYTIRHTLGTAITNLRIGILDSGIWIKIMESKFWILD